MPKDYYIILGISADSSQQDIKSAYRRLAKVFHPDIYKEQHSPFPLIQEAYAVLSDPRQRWVYDRQLQASAVDDRRQTTAEPLTASRRVDVEPLSPRHPPFPGGYRQPVDFFQGHRPFCKQFVEHLFADCGRQQAVGRNRSGSLTVDVVLTERQAAFGGQLRLLLPTQWCCPECGGSGSRGIFSCRRCGNTGAIDGEIPVVFSFPAGIGSGHTITYSLEQLTTRLGVVTIRFRVG